MHGLLCTRQKNGRNHFGVMERLKGPYWVVVGAIIGVAAGAVFGVQYAIAGVGIGMAGGIAVYMAMR